MLDDQVDTKEKEKFCKTFFFLNISVFLKVAITNFSFIVSKQKVSRDWSTQLELFHCSLFTQHYPQASLSKLQTCFEGIRLFIVTATFMLSILLYFQFIHYQHKLKKHIQYVSGSKENLLLNQFYNQSENSKQEALHKPAQRRMESICWLRKSKVYNHHSRWKFFKFLLKKVKNSNNLKCNYNKATNILCIQINLLSP